MVKIENVLDAMMELDKGDRYRMNHFLKVYGYASHIGKMEGLDEERQYILEVAAILHDIAIHYCEEKYGNCSGKYQEIEGPAIAKKMLDELGMEEHLTERVCYLIGHHHTYTDIVGVDYQILVEADFLVNLDEEKSDEKTIANVRKNIFRTESGKRVFDQLFS